MACIHKMQLWAWQICKETHRYHKETITPSSSSANKNDMREFTKTLLDSISQRGCLGIFRIPCFSNHIYVEAQGSTEMGHPVSSAYQTRTSTVKFRLKPCLGSLIEQPLISPASLKTVLKWNPTQLNPSQLLPCWAWFWWIRCSCMSKFATE